MSFRYIVTMLKTLAEKIRSLDKKGAPVAAKAGFQSSRVRVVAAIVDVVVVTGVKSRSRTRRPADNELRLDSSS